ncbi:MAG TPA: LamG domain-containing protein [Verrucomicrobiota bacterium]|nr:LamG domain-containing protein [Verrucomicrobiota bacterium]
MKTLTKPARHLVITGLTAILLSVYAAHGQSLEGGPVALYELDGTGQDSSGNGNHGALTDVVWTEDRSGEAGRACSFNGTSSVITVPHSTTVDIHGTQSLTVAAWIKATAPLRNGETIVGKWGMGFREDDQYFLWLTEEGCPVFIVSDGSHEEQCISSDPIQAGRWHHVTGVFDHGAQHIRLYLDGRLVVDRAVAMSIQSVPVPLRIGQIGAPENAFEGAIDDVRIYDRALSTREVQDLVGTQSGPIAHWEMRQSTPGFVEDVSGNGHSAQVFGTPVFGFASEIGHPFVRFQGASTYLEVPHSDELNLPGDWTFAFWVLQERSLPNQIVLNKVRAYHDDEGGYRLWLGEAPDYAVAVSKYMQFAANPWVKSGSVLPPLWHHVAVTHSSAGNETTFYVDGAMSSVESLPSFQPGNPYDLLVGATKEEDETTINPHTAAFFALADLRIYDRALESEEVAHLIHRTRAYYRCDDDEEQTVKDSAPEGSGTAY